MAEIRIERNERTAWHWVLLGLVLLALLAWWLLSRRGGEEFATTADTSAALTDTGRAAGGPMTATAAGIVMETDHVRDFVDWSRESHGDEGADSTHEITADGIRRLAAAIEAVTRRGDTTGAQQETSGARVDTAGASIRAMTDSLRMSAESLQLEWDAPDHANHARRAFVQAARALQQLRRRYFPDAASTVDQVDRAARQVQGNRPLLDQREQVDRFFALAAQTLQSMRAARS